jgi:hypothetical protein
MTTVHKLNHKCVRLGTSIPYGYDIHTIHYEAHKALFPNSFHLLRSFEEPLDFGNGMETVNFPVGRHFSDELCNSLLDRDSVKRKNLKACKQRCYCQTPSMSHQ